MSKIYLLLAAFLLLSHSCTEINNKNNTEHTDASIVETINFDNPIDTIKSKFPESNQIFIDSANEIDQEFPTPLTSIPKELFNVKLIGLSIKNKNEKDIFKKYWIDFYTSCMGQAPSIFIDPKDNFLYVFNHSSQIDSPIEDENIWHIFEILEIEVSKSKTIISVFDHTNENELDFIFKKLEGGNVYRLSIKGELPLSDIGRYYYYISKAYESNFEKEGCGDFDG